MQQKTYYPKADEISRDWYLVDASDRNLGRLATRIANVLNGKHKPTFTPGADVGDFVVVTNCEQITVTGNKMDDKMYYRHSNYPGGLKEITLKDQLQRFPDRVIRQAVKGMLPKNKNGRQMLRRLKIYAGAKHPHKAQKLELLELD